MVIFCNIVTGWTKADYSINLLDQKMTWCKNINIAKCHDRLSYVVRYINIAILTNINKRYY